MARYIRVCIYTQTYGYERPMWLRLMVSLLSLVVQLQWSEDTRHCSALLTNASPARASTKHAQRLSIAFGKHRRGGSC